MRNDHRLQIGVIADDFTGAGDAASYLSAGGAKTKLVIYPFMEEADLSGHDAVVIALKSRSAPSEAAVRDSLAAARWLRQAGVEKLYFKYCSTFDSTPGGNIGPVCDALLEELHQPCTLLCPALSENGRIVRDGVLYVNGVPLAESHMQYHPLNPMWDSRIPELMAPQSKYPVFAIGREEMADPAALQKRLDELQGAYEHFYLVPDQAGAEDCACIVRRFGTLPLWTGGSELLLHLAAKSVTPGKSEAAAPPSGNRKTYGRLMFCGSCSDMTQKQVNRWLNAGGGGCMIIPEDGTKSESHFLEMAEGYLRNPRKDFLYYSSGSIGLLKAGHTDALVSRRIENVFSRLAQIILSHAPADRVIVAGGETSGAVIQALDLHSFTVGSSIAPGVPILRPQGREMRLVLKSGNFGREDFFLTALKDQEA